MVAVTRAAAALHHQSPISTIAQAAGSLVSKTAKTKRGGKKKVVEEEVTSNILSPSQLFAKTPSITISPPLSSLPLPPTISPTSSISASISTSTAVPILPLTVTSCDHDNDNSDDVIDDIHRVIISPSKKSTGISVKQHEKLYDSDENKKCHTTKT